MKDGFITLRRSKRHKLKYSLLSPSPCLAKKIQTHVTNEKVEGFLLGVMFINNPQKDETVLYAYNRIAQNAHTTSIEIIIEH